MPHGPKKNTEVRRKSAERDSLHQASSSNNELRNLFAQTESHQQQGPDNLGGGFHVQQTEGTHDISSVINNAFTYAGYDFDTSSNPSDPENIQSHNMSPEAIDQMELLGFVAPELFSSSATAEIGHEQESLSDQPRNLSDTSNLPTEGRFAQFSYEGSGTPEQVFFPQTPVISQEIDTSFSETTYLSDKILTLPQDTSAFNQTSSHNEAIASDTTQMDWEQTNPYNQLEKQISSEVPPSMDSPQQDNRSVRFLEDPQKAPSLDMQTANMNDRQTSTTDSRTEIYNRGDKAQRMQHIILMTFQAAKDRFIKSVKELLPQIQTTEQNPALLADSQQTFLHMRDSELPFIHHQVSSLESASKEYFAILRVEAMKPENSSNRTLYLDKLNTYDFWWRQFDQKKNELLLEIEKQISNVDNALAGRPNRWQSVLQTSQSSEFNNRQTHLQLVQEMSLPSEANPQQSHLSDQSRRSPASSSKSRTFGENQSLVSRSDLFGNNEANFTLPLIQSVYDQASSSLQTRDGSSYLPAHGSSGPSSTERQASEKTGTESKSLSFRGQVVMKLNAEIPHRGKVRKEGQFAPEKESAEVPRFSEIHSDPGKLQEHTGLPPNAFKYLSPIFDGQYERHRQKWSLSGQERTEVGKKRQNRSDIYLQTPDERLLFALTHRVKKYSHKQLAKLQDQDMTATATRQWAKTLKSVLKTTMSKLGQTLYPELNLLAQQVKNETAPKKRTDSRQEVTGRINKIIQDEKKLEQYIVLSRKEFNDVLDIFNEKEKESQFDRSLLPKAEQRLFFISAYKKGITDSFGMQRGVIKSWSNRLSPVFEETVDHFRKAQSPLAQKLESLSIQE